MFVRFRLLLNFFLILAFFLSCQKDSAPTQTPDQTVQIKKSPKRGLAYNLTEPADFDTLKSGVSWWYNWSIQTNAPADYFSDYQMEFVPMLWGGNSANDFTQLKYFILNHPEIEYLLVLNEPNLTDQANQTPTQAAVEWIKYEQLVAELAAQQRTIFLVGPAMTWGTMPNYADPESGSMLFTPLTNPPMRAESRKLTTWLSTGMTTVLQPNSTA